MRFKFCILIFSLTHLLWSQPDILWQNTIGGASNDVLHDIELYSDGGHIIGGVSNSNISGEKTENSRGENDFWILRQNSQGTPLWQRTLGGSNSDTCNSICISGETILVGGVSYSVISGDKTEVSRGIGDYWIINIDSEGVIMWQKTIGGEGLDVLTSVNNTDDGGFILGGWSDSNISGEKTENARNFSADYWLLKIDSMGSIEWQKTYGGENIDHLTVVKQTTDAGYIVGGSSSSNISFDKTENSRGDFDYWILKLNSEGNIMWQKTFGGAEGDQLVDLIENPAGGFLSIGYSSSDISGDKTENSRGSSDFWIVSIGADGSNGWQKTIGGSAYDAPRSIYPTFDSQFIIGGTSESSISGEKSENSRGLADCWLVKINQTGDITWQKTIGGELADNIYSLKQISNTGFILGCNSRSGISGEKNDVCRGETDFWLIALDSDTLDIADNITLTSKPYPNPTQKTIYINFEDIQTGEYFLSDVSGKIITKSTYYMVMELAIDIDGGDGIYFLNLKNTQGKILKYKIIKN